MDLLYLLLKKTPQFLGVLHHFFLYYKYYIASGIPFSEDCIEFFMKSVDEEKYKVSVYISRLLWKTKR